MHSKLFLFRFAFTIETNMASIAYLYNDRLDMVKYLDYLKASLDLTKEEREAMILKRKHKTLIKR